MAESGLTTTGIGGALVPALDELIGNRDGNSKRMSVDDFLDQLDAADRFERRHFRHWADLYANAPAASADGTIFRTPSATYRCIAAATGSSITLGQGQIVEVADTGILLASAFGYVADGVTDNADALGKIEAFLRTNGGGHIVFDGSGQALTSGAFIPPSNTTIEIEGEIVNTADGGTWHSYGLLIGQCNREDIARCMGAEETAHDAGSLLEGDSQITVGGRWNNTASDWSNPATWSPQVGDLCVVCTTDNTTSPIDADRPIPSVTHHRRVVEVSGSVITLDEGVKAAGDFMVIPASRNLGYDRTTYGGLGRMETVENVTIRGKWTSQNGFPVLFGGAINLDIDAELNGRAVVYGNGLRGGRIRARGKFTRNALELAIGSEDWDVDLIASHVEAGQTYTVACVQVGERAIGGSLRSRVTAPNWDGADTMAIYATDVHARDVKIKTAATGRNLVIGSAATPADGFRSTKMDLEGGALTGRLIESVNAPGLDLTGVTVHGTTTNADAVLLQDDGRVRRLRLPDIEVGKAIRLNGDYLASDTPGTGTLVTTGTHIDATRIRAQQRSGYLTSQAYAAAFQPTGDFQMVLSGNLELDSPDGADFENGDRILVILQQASPGGHSVTFKSGHLFRGISAPGSGTTSQRWTAEFLWNGAAWVCVGSNGGWAA